MKTLHLNLKQKWFEQIKSGEKTEEYRIRNNYWNKRLEKDYDQVVIKLGYPAKTDTSRVMIFECKGIVEKCVTHEEFGYGVHVYAIQLGERIQ
ncbi:ASCH domain-containing protein [Thiomicrorhabdus indica]|uniref:ASCH domain-containing protein n=1 Tax=Thiomicrorhabdus indica TaxID=2267253 RepID=UPI002AA94FA2|nr:ASCH domain-containing protein [Thiomicrorhabdus indica]